MCNDYEQHIRWQEYKKAIEQSGLRLSARHSAEDLPQADDIRIGDIGPVMRAVDDGVELSPMTFGFEPQKPKGAPVFNFRSEGRHFDKSKRCIIPASAFFEFTGKRYPKAKHRFVLRDAPFLGIAGLWKEATGNVSGSFTMLTTAPGPDVKPYHSRQIVVLRPESWADWLYLRKPESEMLRPLEEGSLEVETVRGSSDGLS